MARIRIDLEPEQIERLLDLVGRRINSLADEPRNDYVKALTAELFVLETLLEAAQEAR